MIVSLLSTILLLKNWIWNVDLGLDIRDVGVDFVESIDKRSVFGLDCSINRLSSMRAFQITTHRLHTTNSKEDIKE